MQQAFQFYSFELELLTEVGLNSIVDGLAGKNKYNDDKGLTHFMPLIHTQDTEFLMVSDITSLDKIEASAIKHNSYEDELDDSYFMVEIRMKNKQLEIKPSEKHSLLLRKVVQDGHVDVVELGEATYMLANLIIEQMTVVRKVKVPDRFYMLSHTKVINFDMEKLPFVIINDKVKGFYLFNIKTCTYQMLLKAKSTRQGFCLK